MLINISDKASKSLTTTSGTTVDNSTLESVRQTPDTSDSTSNVIEVSANGDDFPQVTLDTSQSNSSKEKTPMCLVNELARYNKV